MRGSRSQNRFFVKRLIEAVHTRVEVRDVMPFAERLRGAYRSHSGRRAHRFFKRSSGSTGASSAATNAA